MSSRSTFGTIKRILAIVIAIAIVLAAGILVGQAPALFGVEEDPEASITFEDQERDGTEVTIENVSLSDGGFVVITDGGSEPLAVSGSLEDGTHENVTVDADEDADQELVGQLTATVHQDTTDDGEYAYEETEGEEDRPYLEDGFPVSDTATVTTDEEEGLTDSFVVESVEAPATASTNETIEIVTEIRNPTDFDTQQPVEFRIDGAVLEQRLLDLEAGETRNVSFEVDTRGTEPGERTIGVYTESDGLLESITLEEPTDPALDVVDASDANVTVDAALPADGFVAVTDADNETLHGTSDDLERGEHENVTVEFAEPVGEDENLTVALYEGDPDDVETIADLDSDEVMPIEDDGGERVETTVTVAEAAAADDDGDDDDEAEAELDADANADDENGDE